MVCGAVIVSGSVRLLRGAPGAAERPRRGHEVGCSTSSHGDYPRELVDR